MSKVPSSWCDHCHFADGPVAFSYGYGVADQQLMLARNTLMIPYARQTRGWAVAHGVASQARPHQAIVQELLARA